MGDNKFYILKYLKVLSIEWIFKLLFKFIWRLDFGVLVWECLVE